MCNYPKVIGRPIIKKPFSCMVILEAAVCVELFFAFCRDMLLKPCFHYMVRFGSTLPDSTCFWYQEFN